jgi:hypothetical protein
MLQLVRCVYHVVAGERLWVKTQVGDLILARFLELKGLPRPFDILKAEP